MLHRIFRKTKASEDEGVISTFLSWLGDDAVQLNAKDMQKQLEQTAMLLSGEFVAMAHRAGCDAFILTNRRVMYIDVNGWTGNRINYLSVPYSSLRALSVKSAGSWDRDTELTLHIKNYWNKQTLTQFIPD